MWLTIKFLLMLSVTYFVRRLFGWASQDASSLGRAAFLPNALSFIGIFGVVSAIKFFASDGASILHIQTTASIILLAQTVWLVFDWFRYDARRPSRDRRS